MALLVLPKATFLEENESFFDLKSTTAIRAVCCIVVILVHVQPMHQNKIQDMIGSFGFVAVTFFFMTSAFGLKVSYIKNPEGIKYFWRRRLPGILIPVFLTNLIGCVITAVNGKKLGLLSFIAVDLWIVWLLICYLFFWIFYSIKSIKHKDILIAIAITAFSLIVFFLGDRIPVTTWVTEIYGFVWGLALADHKESFRKKSLDGWLWKGAALLILSGLSGIAYLRFKQVFFCGNYLLKIVLGIIILLLVLHLLTRIKIGNKLSAFVGAVSFEVFLLHGKAFDIVEMIDPGMNSGVFIALSILITIVLAFAVHEISKRLVGRIRKALVPDAPVRN